MTYAFPFTRLSFGGELADGQDVWSCGLAFYTGDLTETTLLNHDYLVSQITNIGQAIVDFVGLADMRVPNNVKLYWAKLAYLDTNGHYLMDAAETPLDWGGAINAPYSPQDALVMGLQSDKWKDPGKNNRFYLPTAGPSDTNAWKFTPTQQGLMAEGLGDFIDALNVIGSGSPNAVAPYVAVVSNSGIGHSNPVTNVRVGAIVDTQRRRRNKLSEEYVSRAVTPAP